MKTDITLPITPEMIRTLNISKTRLSSGHVGTHFDVMDQQFPLSYTELPGTVFDVSGIRDSDIEVSDIDTSRIKEGMFVIFHTGFIEEKGYGTPEYRHDHPQLSHDLIDFLIAYRIAIIGIDCDGVRRGDQHHPADMHCAENGVFIIENLCNLQLLINRDSLIIHTYPLNWSGLTGLPCRVIAETAD